MCDEFKQSMKKKFDLADLRRMRCFLGVEIKQDINKSMLQKFYKNFGRTIHPKLLFISNISFISNRYGT